MGQFTRLELTKPNKTGILFCYGFLIPNELQPAIALSYLNSCKALCQKLLEYSGQFSIFPPFATFWSLKVLDPTIGRLKRHKVDLFMYSQPNPSITCPGRDLVEREETTFYSANQMWFCSFVQNSFKFLAQDTC